MPKRISTGVVLTLTGGVMFAAAVVMVPRYSGAFASADAAILNGWLSDTLTAGAAIAGVGMGLLDVFGTAYIADAWRRNMPPLGKRWSARFRWLTAFLVANVIEAMIILTPYTVARVYGVGITDIMPFWMVVLWCMVVVAAPFLVIGGVVFSNPGVLQNDRTPIETPTKTIETKPIEPEPIAEVIQTRSNGHKQTFPCPDCDRVFDTRNGLSGHIKKHRKAETI
jgi:hypothetical protein